MDNLYLAGEGGAPGLRCAIISGRLQMTVKQREGNDRRNIIARERDSSGGRGVVGTVVVGNSFAPLMES